MQCAKEMDVSILRVGKPVREENCLFAKVRHKSDKTKVNIFIKDVKLIKRVSIDDPVFPRFTSLLDLQIPREVRRKFTEIDEYIVSQVQLNKTRWFSKGLDSNVIDELYKRSIVPTSTASSGGMLRVRLVQSPDDLDRILQQQEAGGVDVDVEVVLLCRGLRFFKHCFCLEWQLVTVQKSSLSTPLLVSDEEDVEYGITGEDTSIGMSDTCVCPGPSPEEMNGIIEDLRVRCVELRGYFEDIRARAAENAEKLSVLEDMTLAHVRKWSEIDRVAEELDDIARIAASGALPDHTHVADVCPSQERSVSQ